MNCEICGEGTLHPKEEWNEVEQGFCLFILPLRYSWCDVCESEMTDAAQARFNKQAMVDANHSLGLPGRNICAT